MNNEELIALAKRAVAYIEARPEELYEMGWGWDRSTAYSLAGCMCALDDREKFDRVVDYDPLRIEEFIEKWRKENGCYDSPVWLRLFDNRQWPAKFLTEQETFVAEQHVMDGIAAGFLTRRFEHWLQHEQILRPPRTAPDDEEVQLYQRWEAQESHMVTEKEQKHEDPKQ